MRNIVSRIILIVYITVVRLCASLGEPPGAHEQVLLQKRPRRGAEPLPAARQRPPA